EGCGSPVVRVSDNGWHVMSSSPEPLKTHRVGQRCTLNLSRDETSSNGRLLSASVFSEMLFAHGTEILLIEDFLYSKGGDFSLKTGI
ncbi:hypothetical protein TNCV_1301911, partial [Trichonephila clavipes]